MKYLKYITVIALCAVVIVAIGFINRDKVVLGSVQTSEGYYSTTTNGLTTGLQTVGAFKLLHAGTGILGSVVLTYTGTGVIELYDATTTAQGATYGTTTLAQFPASVAAGTYTFDAVFSKGLLVVSPTGVIATTTITWK